MFPSLRSPRNIMGNNVSATMCPRLPGPLLSSKALLRSRGTRERILILFRQQESRVLDCKLAALSFCRGFGPRFCVHWAQNEARSCFGVFRSVRPIDVFLKLVFTPMAIDKKKCSPSADWTELF